MAANSFDYQKYTGVYMLFPLYSEYQLHFNFLGLELFVLGETIFVAMGSFFHF